MKKPGESGQVKGVLGDQLGEVDGLHQGRSSLRRTRGVYIKEAEDTDLLEQVFSNHNVH